ncbi:MAG: pilus assembly protein TadG-related protein, partial [Actinomycetota bacterium]|nr:pilus assembly protein TadG-related protein [Actinomycetota bacterium]
MRARLDIASERGGILVMVAILLPTLILFASFVVETGNWWVQKRHLQVQADAAALAAAGDFQIPCSDVPIASRVSDYRSRNQWSSTASRTFGELNAPSFHNQSTPNESDMSGSPCADKAIDVKMTETDVPWFFRAANVDFINARARVSFRTITANQGVLPVGVPATEPKRVRVTFVDESSGATLGTRDLVRRTDAVNGLRIWDNAVDNGGSPLGLDVTQSHIGVRVAVSGSSSTVACADAYVQCYDLGSANGLAHIRGWSDQPAVGSTAAPQARSVFLNTPGGSTGCSDAYFSSGTACTIGVSAKVDFSSGAASTSQSDRQVTATV